MLCLVGDVGGVVKPSISVASFLLRLGGERGMGSESECFLLGLGGERGMGFKSECFLLRLGGERGMGSESECFLLRRGMGGGAVIAFG